jgi:hypothetical protein
MEFVCLSLSFNCKKKVKTFLDNERKDAFQYIQEAPEDAISGALVLLYAVDAIYFYIIYSLLEEMHLLKILADSSIPSTLYVIHYIFLMFQVPVI